MEKIIDMGIGTFDDGCIWGNITSNYKIIKDGRLIRRVMCCSYSDGGFDTREIDLTPGKEKLIFDNGYKHEERKLIIEGTKFGLDTSEEGDFFAESLDSYFMGEVV